MAEKPAIVFVVSKSQTLKVWQSSS